MAETTVSDTGTGSAPQRTASKTGSWIQRNKPTAIAIGIVLAVIIFYLVFRSRSSSGGTASGSATGAGGSTISPSDLAGLLSSIPQGPPGATGIQGPPGPPGKQGPPGKNPKPPKKHHHHHKQANAHSAVPALRAPVNNTHYQASPPVHQFSQKPAVRR